MEFYDKQKPDINTKKIFILFLLAIFSLGGGITLVVLSRNNDDKKQIPPSL